MGRPKVPRIVVDCFACGKSVPKYPSEVQKNRTGRFFCSSECLYSVGGCPAKYRPKTCEWCRREYRPWGKERDSSRWCSRDCQAAFHESRRTYRSCEYCGKRFSIKPSQLHNITGRWCSRPCSTAATMKRPTGRMHNGKPAVFDRQGYVRVFQPDAPGAAPGGWIQEHRYIAQVELGRPLVAGEHVHHINGKKDDNRPENLQVMTHGEHSTITGLENGRRLREWEEYRRRYGPLDA